MKNTIIGGIFGLLATVLAVWFGHYLTKENIDIRYTLSDSIPAKFLGTGSLSNIQQLEIMNSGDKTAENIRIKFNKKITQYELTKYSELDKVDENFSNKSLEFLYPELPPEGKVNIVFSSDVIPLNMNDVDIYHSKGVGRKAFDEKDNVFFSIVFVPVIYFLMVVVFTIIVAINFQNKWLERDADRGNQKILIRKNKPFFMGSDRWNELRKEAIENYVKNSNLRSYDIEGSEVVVYLNSEKPEYLKDHEWKLLIKESQNFFSEKVPSLFEFSFFYEKNIERFFKLAKPKHFPQNKWNEILKKLHDLYMLNLKENAVNTTSFVGTNNIINNLKIENTYGINPRIWNDYKNILNKIYVVCLVNDLCRYHKNYVDHINQQDLSFIDESDAEFIRDIAYKLQINTRYASPFTVGTAKKFLKTDKEEWLKDEDYKELKLIAEKNYEFQAKKAKLDSIENLFYKVRFLEALPEIKPSELTDEEWKEIRKLEEDIVSLITEKKEILSKNEKVLNEIKQKEESIPGLIQKLNFQLSTINEFLTDPTVLDRVEDYNNTFSPGNFINLTKISALLKKL